MTPKQHKTYTEMIMPPENKPGSHSRLAASRMRGFTLVELLVVIGILAVLMSLLLPVTSLVRARARETGCQSNTRQIWQATMMVTRDLNGRLPRPALIWDNVNTFNSPGYGDFAWVMVGSGVADLNVGLLYKYLGTKEDRAQVMICPSDRGERPHLGGGFQNIENRNFSYSYNANIRPTSAGDPVLRLAQVKRPAARILLFEEFGPNDAWCLNPRWNPDDYPSNRHGKSGKMRTGGPGDPGWEREGRGIHTFFDGHVELLEPALLMSNEGDAYYGPLD